MIDEWSKIGLQEVDPAGAAHRPRYLSEAMRSGNFRGGARSPMVPRGVPNPLMDVQPYLPSLGLYAENYA